jgi:hypothetical protein
MAYYLQYQATTGSVSSNADLLQISGITGSLSSVQYTLKNDMPSLSITRYLFDIRRLPNTSSDGGGTGFLLQEGNGNITSSGTSGHSINGSSVSSGSLFSALDGDVCKFSVNSTPSGGCISFGARYNNRESSYGMSIAEIVIIDSSGTHTIDMSSSNGAGNSVTSDTGNITADLKNFPVDNSQWVFYSGGGGLTIITSPIVSGEVVGSPTFTTGTVLIDPVAIATAESVGNPTIAFGVTVINPTAIASVELVGEPVVVPLGVVLQPTVIVTEEVVGSPVVTAGLSVILPTAITTEEAVGEPFVELLLKQIFPTGILSLADVGRPIVLGGDSIIIPIASRQTWNAVAKYLRALVFTGHDNDVIMKWLRSEGYEDAYNDNWDDYLLGQGYLQGALTDRYAQWRQGVAGDDPWILSEGSWNDAKIWRDTENWRDN